ncbi:Por secretion system C-terminal sorting domain-containing protein [Tenacibaculum sp. MAR_2009_124]|uniref:glycosyl hydrolase family 18 protein n=1 Tax=Tenacibaculum sp. MAR_2009_124 TaxID=1250059 RepID=UPI000895548E|nr:glycosyl hydrolase family 18 protein [Tenacibaculum sp. MAR_2009_124]SEB35615.1 Por secretion system C-terminal sorting domain-containing protein [Tenacibaculum sp. MAR_2009_124]
MKKIVFLLVLFLSACMYAQYQFPACYPAHETGKVYRQGEKASLNGINYTAKYYTTAAPGDASWQSVGACGDGGLGADYPGPQRIIGYLPTWIPDYDIKNNFNPEVVTNINVSFLMFKRNNNDYNSADFGSIAFDDFQLRKVDSVLTDCRVLEKAKAKNVKVSVALGGATDYAFLWLMTKYYNNDQKLEEIANLLVNYINARKIDGIDLDLECWWADPAIAGTSDQGGRVRGSKWGDRDQGPHPAAIGMTNLSKKLRQKMPNKLITAAVFGTSWYGNNYDADVAQYMDWIGLMTYDFTGSWDKSPIGPHSSLHKLPLNTYPKQNADNPIYSAQDALEYWLGIAPATWNHAGGFGVKKAKLAIGVPMYGYDFSEKKPGGGNGAKFVPYRDIIAEFPNAATSYDQKDPKKLNGHVDQNGKNIYFDTPKQAGEKIKYTKNFGHQGVIIWELTQDVAYNSSSSILKAINEAAGNNTPVNQAPVVTWQTPTDNLVIEQDVLGAVALKATATDSDGTVTAFSFKEGANVITATKNGNDYTASFTPTSFGEYVLTAEATDNKSAITTKVIRITVKEKSTSNQAPVVTWQTPTDNLVIEQDVLGAVALKATATDNDGTVTTFVFKEGVNVITATKTGNDYTASFNPASFGEYALTAEATDDKNAITTKTIRITVKEKNTTNPAPVISNVKPLDGSIIEQTALAAITLQATVTDDNSVGSVEFFINNASQGVVTSAGADVYSSSWTPQAFGNFNFKVVATDNQGEVTTTTVSFTIKEKSTGGCDNIPAWEPKTYAKAGTEVSHNGDVYKNKWYASAGEEPGKSGVWQYLRPCGGVVTFCGVEAYRADRVYNSGDKAYYMEKIYAANWWTKGTNPSSSGDWSFDSDCPQTPGRSALNEIKPQTLVKDFVNIQINTEEEVTGKIELYSLSGQLVKTIMNPRTLNGKEVIRENISDLRNGVYVYKIFLNNEVITQKMVISK